MALEIANPIPASGALPRTRSMKKNYASLAEGPISSQLLRDGTPLLSQKSDPESDLCSLTIMLAQGQLSLHTISCGSLP